MRDDCRSDGHCRANHPEDGEICERRTGHAGRHRAGMGGPSWVTLDAPAKRPSAAAVEIANASIGPCEHDSYMCSDCIARAIEAFAAKELRKLARVVARLQFPRGWNELAQDIERRAAKLEGKKP